MPSALPDGDPAPADGALPARRSPARDAAVRVLRARAVLRGALRLLRLQHLHRDRARRTCPARRGRRTPTRRSPRSGSPAGCSATSTVPVETVFFGGGTPTLLPPDDLARIARARSTTSSGSRPGAEVTTEANPDSVDAGDLARLREGGFNRVSFGMQSAVPHVLRVLDRTHDPRAGARRSCGWAREAGFEQVSLDLIYGTPGESLDDWRTSLDAALACEPDHVSAYALIVEEGTALARQVRRGEVPMPDDDDLADKYLLADEALERGRAAAGTRCRTGRARRGRACRHNVLYWTRRRLVGRRPGRALPRRRRAVVERQAPDAVRRADRARASARPTAARCSTTETRRVERVLLETRLREGLPVDVLDDAGRAALPGPGRARPRRAGRAGSGPGRADPAGPAARRRRGPRPAPLMQRMIAG